MEKVENLEKQLLKKIALGDEKSFEYIFNVYYKQLFAYARNLLLDEELAKDILQETFYKFWNSRKQIDTIENLRPYLYRMTHNQCLDFLRQHKYEEQSNLNDLQHRLDLLGFVYNDSILNNLFSEEMFLALRKSINKLPPQCKKIFQMNREEDLSYKEIAEKLNLSISTVKNQMMIAMNRLKEELKEHFIIWIIMFIKFIMFIK